MNEIKGQKERLSKINELLDRLDEKLAQGEITEAKYRELSERYKAEADGLKNLITEKELMQEVGLRAEEKDEEIVEYQEEKPEKPIFKERKIKYCSNCGAVIDELAEICPKCGVRVSVQPILENKNVALAAVLSFIIPGIGQMYCGKMKRGVSILVLSIFMFFIFGATAASAGANSSEPLFPFLMWILVYIWNIYDAYKLAEKINRREA